MSKFSITATHSIITLIGTLTPAGVTADDGWRRIHGKLNSELGKIGFIEEAADGENPRWLGLKKGVASYTTKMSGETAEVQTRAIDTYKWLKDTWKYEKAHGECTPGFRPALRDYLTSIVADMKPGVDKKEDNKEDNIANGIVANGIVA